MDNNYDPFAEDQAIDDAYARPRGLDTLNPGQAYPIIKMFSQKSKFQDNGVFPNNTVVQYYENGLKFQSILPKRHNNKEERWFQAMNKLIDSNMGPKLVYYGKTGQSHEYELLRHTQDVDVNKLNTVNNIMSRSNNNVTPTKRQAETPPTTPGKQLRLSNDGENSSSFSA